ncbi:hypothetical protein GCM10007886_29770 [Methylobacterium gregans]|uniref:helix-turn-helix domain-containing protein n=1 Tax=Methylobacterium gregans TaxID=374424 RepID=UPI001EE38622|nr:helix-turn-helix domain-containing protein [Methylobacterium gregans]MDQ0523763.1 hypothetical protein [Methylobacterium gregans]GLS54793.1 hypothetical protein GCM10007886_29770 [Methylobacterium gregans]
MTDPSRALSVMTLLHRLADATVTAYNRDRRQNPERFVGCTDGLGPDFLFVENVARLLGCNVDHVRRVPRSELPASKIGQRLVYARADVEAYIRSKRDTGTARHVATRGPQKLQLVAADQATRATPFDPVARAKRLLKEGQPG